MNKSDYDKYYKKGGTYVIPVEVFNDLCDELERQISNYEQALEDLDKKDNIIKEVREYIDKAELGEDTEGDIVYLKDDLCGIELLEILNKVD